MKRTVSLVIMAVLCACSQSVGGDLQQPKMSVVKEQPQPRTVNATPSKRRYGIGIQPPSGGEKVLPVLLVAPDGVAMEAGLRKDDVIVAINDTLVADLSPGQISTAMRSSPLEIKIDRQGTTLTLEMSLDGPNEQTSVSGDLSPAATEVAFDYSSAAFELADILEARYLFPDTGAAYANMLRDNTAKGVYREIADAGTFAGLITQQLAAVSADRHLHVTPPGSDSIGRQMVRGGPGSFDLSESVPESGWLADGVAFMRIALMPSEPTLKAWAAKFMEDHSEAQALVLDLRMCRGGTIDMMNGFLPYLYGEETHLLNMDMREGAAPDLVALNDEIDELKRVSADGGLVRWEHRIKPSAVANKPDIPVYVLTGFTGSACEHLTLALKATDRATIIGKTTAGAGHFATIAEFGGGFTLLLPVGRTYDPETGKGWEGVGIEPDIAVDPDLADEKALELFRHSRT